MRRLTTVTRAHNAVVAMLRLVGKDELADKLVGADDAELIRAYGNRWLADGTVADWQAVCVGFLACVYEAEDPAERNAYLFGLECVLDRYAG